MTIAQIRNEIHRMQRKFARELAVFRLRQIADEIADDWTIAQDKSNPAPPALARAILPSTSP